MSKRNMTCIVCPVGCRLEVTLDESGKVASVTGNSCPRGVKYAVSEVTNPVRTLTSTVRLSGSAEAFLPVKTASPIPKGKMFEAMAFLRGLSAFAPVKRGDVIASFEGVPIVSGKTVSGKTVSGKTVSGKTVSGFEKCEK